jgi:hypothetical protein
MDRDKVEEKIQSFAWVDPMNIKIKGKKENKAATIRSK